MLRSIEQYINNEEKKRIYEILEAIYGKYRKKDAFCFVGLGQNYVAFRFQVNTNQVCIKFLVSNQIEKFCNLGCALSVCEAHNIQTSRVVYKDVTCEKIHLPFMIMTFLEGTTIELHRYSDLERQSFFHEFGGYLARIHNIHSNFFCKSIATKETIDLKSYVSQRFVMLQEKLAKGCGIELTYQDEIKQVFERLYHTIAFDQIRLSLVHRDISESNLIVWGRTLQGLIDFEHACYFDCVWDFVKLQLNLLSEVDVFCEECFWDEYTKIHPLGEVTNVERRYQIYYLLELMWAVVNDYRYERAKYRNLLIELIHSFR